MKGRDTKTHRDLEIWQLGIDLVTRIYRLTKKFPEEELYGLTSQMRRAAIPYPSNISEGAARDSINDYIRFLYISMGSLSELETQIIISGKLGYIKNSKDILEVIEIITRKTYNLIKYLKSKKD